MRLGPSISWLAFSTVLLVSTPSFAQLEPAPVQIGGYFRVMARPDFQGGTGRLGFWNLYGRLMNEDPFAAVDLQANMIPAQPDSNRVWTTAHVRVEAGSIRGASFGNGAFNSETFRIAQVFARAGNILLDDVVWQMGTLEYWVGDLALYDARPSQLFFGTIGLSATLRKEKFELLLGVGDSGFIIRGFDYSPILTAGGFARFRFNRHFEVGLGGQFGYEPQVNGNRYSPYQTPNTTYEDFYRGEVFQNYLQANPGQEDLFYMNNPPQPTDASSYKLVGYVGFGGFGPLRWSSLHANFLRLHPNNFVTESNAGVDYTVYVKEFTDEQYQVNLGNEMYFQVVPEFLDIVWGVLVGYHWNDDNRIASGEDNRVFGSTVLRLQSYLTEHLHFLLETSLAHEKSQQGDLFRIAHDSIFQSSGGQSDSRGLEFGDTDERNTWQLKFGPVINPGGFGVFSRPSLRVLFGLQRSSVHDAFNTRVTDTLDDFNMLGATAESRYWHYVFGLEAEAWF